MLSEELRKLRRQKKINQAMLAEAVGMSQATVASWEKGTRKPDVETLSMLADYFNVTVDVLMGRTSETASTGDDTSAENYLLEEGRQLFALLNEEQQRHIIENMKFLISQNK